MDTAVDELTPRGEVNRRSCSIARRRMQWLIFYHDSMKSTALQLKELMGEGVVLSQLEWKRFNDGFPNLQINKEDCHRLEEFHGTCILVSFHNTDVIFEQLCLLQALPKMRARNFHVILPWFCTGTMERVETLGQIATAKSLADLLSCTPLGPSGPCTLVTYDIHWVQEQFYFSDRLLVELKSAMVLGARTLLALQDEAPDEKVVVAFPDEGAHKKMQDIFRIFPHIVCDKVRNGDKRIVTLKEGEGFADGSHVVIVDDMVMSGGLMLECAAQLRARGALKISCFTVHAVMPQDGWKKFVGKGFHRFWITDTVPTTAAAVQGQEPFEVLSIAPLIAQYLDGIIED